MEKSANQRVTEAFERMLRTSGMTEPQYIDVKARSTRMVNDLFRKSYGSTQYEISLIPTAFKGKFAFTLCGDRNNCSGHERSRLPDPSELFTPETEFLMDLSQILHQYGLRRVEGPILVDLPSQCRFQILTPDAIRAFVECR